MPSTAPIYQDAALSDSAKAQYAYWWQRWERWAFSRNARALPAQPTDLFAFFAELKEGGCSLDTVLQAFSAISKAHGGDRADVYERFSPIRAALALLKRDYVVNKIPILAEAIRRGIVEEIGGDPLFAKDISEHRRRNIFFDIALCFLIYAEGLRSTETARLTWGDVDFQNRRIGILLQNRGLFQGSVLISVAVSDAAMDALLDLKPADADEADPVFVSSYRLREGGVERKRAMSVKQLRRRYRSAAARYARHLPQSRFLL